MAWDRQFFDQRRLTSKLKHIVLSGYVKEFAYHLGSVRDVIYYTDGFAGAGSYAHGSTSEDGSPLLIARQAKQIRMSAHPFNLRCLNVEANRKRFESLEAATAPFKPEIVEQNYHSTFIEALPDILRRVGHAPAFFFIDPFGTKGIAFKELLPIFQRRDRTEVLITLHTDGIAKKAGYFRREDSSDSKVRATALELTQHLASALGISHARLRKGWLESANTAEFEDRVLKYYLKRLVANDTQFNYAKAFRVMYYRNDAFAEAPVCFQLVFATQSEKGLFVMNDRMVDAVRKFNSEVYSDSFFPQFEDEHERRVGRVAVMNEILSRFASRTFTIDDVKRHCMQSTDYLLKGSEYRALLLDMAKPEASLKKLDAGQPSNANTRFRVVSTARQARIGLDA